MVVSLRKLIRKVRYINVWRVRMWRCVKGAFIRGNILSIRLSVNQQMRKNGNSVKTEKQRKSSTPTRVSFVWNSLPTSVSTISSHAATLHTFPKTIAGTSSNARNSTSRSNNYSAWCAKTHKNHFYVNYHVVISFIINVYVEESKKESYIASMKDKSS